jgi:cytochrome c nitrite reductase small subunit
MATIGLAALVGLAIGVGSFTFHYGKGWSYFSGTPESCANCHIMEPHYDTWLKSSHHAVATCTGCHLPADFPASILSKAENGWNHSWAFTMQNFHEPIQMTAKNRRILQRNCVRCHQALVHQMLAHQPQAGAAESVTCVQCHAGVGHTLPPR